MKIWFVSTAFLWPTHKVLLSLSIRSKSIIIFQSRMNWNSPAKNIFFLIFDQHLSACRCAWYRQQSIFFLRRHSTENCLIIKVLKFVCYRQTFWYRSFHLHFLSHVYQYSVGRVGDQDKNWLGWRCKFLIFGIAFITMLCTLFEFRPIFLSPKT